jgi:3-hydroxyisobutyrate dehydrogenase-like beta-hydroxyacid dehydrogenase
MPGQTIGARGLGIMGSAVSANLLLERVGALATPGGRGATSVRALAAEAPVMISLLPSPGRRAR